MLNIALNTFREIRRNKYLYLILFFAVIFITFSLLLSKLSMGENEKIIVDFWLASIEIFGIIGVLFVGSQLLFNEIEGKTIFLLLSKPIKRYEFILGKFFGFSIAIFFITLFQGIVFLAMLLIKDIEITKLISWSLINTFLKLEIMLGAVFFFSSFMSNLLTIVMSIMVYLVGHSFSTLRDIAINTKNTLAIEGTKIVELFFPPFEALNTKDHIWSFENFSSSYFFLNLGYSLLYLVILLWATILLFSRKKFEN